MNNYRNYCEIDLGAISHNYLQIRKLVDEKVQIMGVVKADAYGHGALSVSEILINNGINYLAVATLDEALEIRGVYDIPILVLGYIESELISTAIDNNITMTVYDLVTANQINEVAKKRNKNANIHIKVDTGMHRLGFLPTELDEIVKIKNLDYLHIEGIFTHFSCADTDNEYTYNQYSKFIYIRDELEKYFKFKYIHCCNSAATLNFPEMHLNMVRVGLLLYGLNPFDGKEFIKFDFKPAMSVKTKIVSIKTVDSEVKIGYGGNHITKSESVIATIPFGYADGLNRRLSNIHKVLINGYYAPIIGNICMDQCMIDITGIPNVSNYDEVVLIGTQNTKNISVDDISHILNTINYEIICSFSNRVPRTYIK